MNSNSQKIYDIVMSETNILNVGEEHKSAVLYRIAMVCMLYDFNDGTFVFVRDDYVGLYFPFMFNDGFLNRNIIIELKYTDSNIATINCGFVKFDFPISYHNIITTVEAIENMGGVLYYYRNVNEWKENISRVIEHLNSEGVATITRKII